MPEPLRILHMLPDLQVGGGQELLLRNASALQALGVQSYICGVRPLGGMEGRFSSAGLPLYTLGMRRLRDLPAAVARVSRLVKRLGIDLIHTNNTGPDKLLGELAALRSGIPTVNTLHSEFEPPRRPGNPALAAASWGRHRTARILERTTVRHAVAVSQRALETWLPHLRSIGLSAAQASVIRAGIELSSYAPADPEHLAALRQGLGLGSAAPVLLNVARLVPGKGQRLLVPAMWSIVARWPRARLLLAGEGPDRPVLEQMIREAGLERSIQLLGARADIPDLLQIADLFIFPSMGEGFGLAPLEAMAAGKPVVAFRLPSLEEFIDDHPARGSGILVDRGDAEALAQAAISVLDEPERARAMGEAGHRIVATRFTLAGAAAALEGVYKSVLEGCPAVLTLPRPRPRRSEIPGRHAQAGSSSASRPSPASWSATSAR